MNVYCAGPLFNDAERSEMKQISDFLEQRHHRTFLPQRDGLEFAKLHPEFRGRELDAKQAESVLARAIFSLDVYKLLSWSDVVVANLNGRVADEGTVVEAALAWHSGKVLVLFKSDARSMLNGFDNPMLTGLGNFVVCSRINDLDRAISEAMERHDPDRVSAVTSLGEMISDTKARNGGLDEMVGMLSENIQPVV